ncbi:MAG: hypothetical protein PWQ96_2029 [Clostridia bacterium]|nr:hypothetical protein [Clostridia bacterium]
MMETKADKVVPIKEFKRKKRKKKFKPFFIKLVIISAILIFAALKIYNIAIFHLVKTKVVNGGTLENTVFVEGMVLREEKIIRAPARGKFFQKVATGSRVREGQVIGIVKSGEGMNGKTYQVKATEAGLISFSMDNLENILNPQKFQILPRRKLNELSGDATIIENGSEVYRGSPVAKIANNLHPLLILIQPQNEIFKKIIHYKTENLQIKIFDKEVFKAEITEIDNENNIIMLKVLQWDKQFLNERRYKFDLVLDTCSGIVVPSTAILKKDGKKGLYIYNGEDYVWKPVEVTFQVGENVTVRGIDEGSLVVINPGIIEKKSVSD